MVDWKLRHYYDVLVLDASLRQSLVTVRSLGRRNIRVAALETIKRLEKSVRVPTFASRWCRGAFIAPPFEPRVEPFLFALHSFAKHIGVQTFIPSSDGTIAVLRAHRANLERQGVHIALANEEALSVAINKQRTLALARELGVGIPRGIEITHVDDVAAAVHEVGLPAVVKPVETWRWQGDYGIRLVCKLVRTLDEARLAVEELTGYGCSVLLQQYLAGRREAISLLTANGEVYARFAQWAKRTHPPLGGISVYRQSIALPADITLQAETLVRHIGLDGYAEVEFRRDLEGNPYLMEINPRLSASIELAVRSGVDFPYLLYQWAMGEPIELVEGYTTGKWMRFLEGDLLATLSSFTQRSRPDVLPPSQALKEFLAAFLFPADYDYFDWRDPLPAWTAICEFGERLWWHITQ